MSNLRNNIIDKIKKENVKPKSRWLFVLMHSFLWLTVIISIMIGGLATAVVIRHLTITDWHLAKFIKPNPIHRFIVLLPYLWLFFIGIIIFIADKLFQQTKKGYRIRPIYLVLGSILISVILGISFFLIKADQPFEHVIRQNFPPYKTWETKQTMQFMAPQLGVLVGEIKNIEDNEQWQLIDFKDQLWVVNVTGAKISDSLIPIPGEKVGMQGELIGPRVFRAIHINRWDDARTIMERRLKEMRRIEGMTPKELIKVNFMMEESTREN